jgi:hypothetical protein
MSGIPLMNVTRPRLIAVAATALVVGTVAAVVFLGVQQLARSRVTEVSLQPQAVRLLGEGGDPLVVMVGVTWREDGYCSGQFHVKATETTTEVRVGTVVSRLYSNRACAGLGTVNNMAWAELTLASPLGMRVVVRNSDGVVLPVLAP